MRLRAAIAKFLEEQDAAAKLQATTRMTQAADKVHEHRCMNTYVAVGYQCIRTSPPVDFHLTSSWDIDANRLKRTHGSRFVILG